jgi:hypothetical protein
MLVFPFPSRPGRALPAPCPLPGVRGIRCGPLAESSAKRSLWGRGRCVGRCEAMCGGVSVLRALASTRWRPGPTRPSQRPPDRLVGREWVLHPPGPLTLDGRGSPRPLEGDACDGRLRRRRRGVTARENAACRVQWSVRDSEISKATRKLYGTGTEDTRKPSGCLHESRAKVTRPTARKSYG